jgi:hypothetical protein
VWCGRVRQAGGSCWIFCSLLRAHTRAPRTWPKIMLNGITSDFYAAAAAALADQERGASGLHISLLRCLIWGAHAMGDRLVGWFGLATEVVFLQWNISSFPDSIEFK